MSETKPKKPDDGKSSVQVRIDRGLLTKSREVAKGRKISLDALTEEVLKFGCDPFPGNASAIEISGQPSNETDPSPFPDLNPGTLADAEAFCEKRGWTLSYLTNRALIHELERAK